MLQSVTLVIKLIPIIVIVIFGIFQSGDITFSLIPTTGNSGNGFFTAIGSGLLQQLCLHMMVGFMYGNVAGTKNPKRDLPLAISVGIGCIMAVYLLINATFYY
ncbi:amino acid permease [Staphylococcus aureus]|nr:amino acid permease [Staphylococcus aureus]